MIGRRGFLSMLGMSTVAGPAAARQIADGMTADLAGVSMIGGAGASYPTACAPAPDVDTVKGIKLLRQLPALWGEYESTIYDQERQVSRIDHDIASMRSFSLAAKITFQRQRNVARQIENAATPWQEQSWGHAATLLKRALGPFG